MSQQRSEYDLRGIFEFTTEKLWFRLVVFIITAAFWLGIVWALREWVLPVLTAKGIAGIKLDGLLRLFGRKPS